MMADKYSTLERCRICGNAQLAKVLDLGRQELTGVFPRTMHEAVTSGPLQLVKCTGDGTCGLLQLGHSFDLNEMYGDNYGYRSGLNPSMVAHLQAKVARVRQLVDLGEGDLVLDIGSNDGTTLAAYPCNLQLDLLGIDPTAEKFRDYYPAHVGLAAEFFSAELFSRICPGRKARVVTSFSMFYDLEEPQRFMQDVHEVLANNGIWMFEQSYMPSMLEMSSYDTVCHEHLEYYALRQVKWMADRTGFRIVDLEFNDVNGGSFSVAMAKSNGHVPESPEVARVLAREDAAGLDTLDPYRKFAVRVEKSRRELREFINNARAGGRVVGALGASTKGNVLLQYCGLGPDDIVAIGEVNQDKIGRSTPGTRIPIVDESELLARKPDYLMVLPWHFRQFFLGNPRFDAFTLVFPLPSLEIITAEDRHPARNAVARDV
jgi:NDP-4-keto-2,6-dideoxyhexose 3-C-methyltransferase